MSSIRVRFAPSPTGYLHVGGARTALFNLLFARRTGGRFVLRIEDTDRERSRQEHVTGILDGMKWLGLSWDEGPYYQSDGFEAHRAAALRLVAEGRAYHSFALGEASEQERGEGAARTLPDRDRLRASDEEVARRHAAGEPSCIRFLVPPGATEWDDLIHGATRFENDQIEDLVLLRTDGSPTYNLSVVCDDIGMGITHVVRGDDHISNTPKQILLYRALGATAPRFGHVPLILGADKKRLSKRHGATSVLAYRDQGIPSEAMLNFLGLLGWSPGEDHELMSFDELCARFDFDGCGSSSAVFDTEKLLWMSGEHLRRLPLAELTARLAGWLSDRGVTWDDPSEVERFVALALPRARTYVDLAAAVACYLRDDVDYQPEAITKHLVGEGHADRLARLRAAWQSLPDWEAGTLEQTLREVAGAVGVAAGGLIHPLRVALLGVAVSPGIFDVVTALGRSRTLTRIERLERLLRAGTLPRGA